MRERINQFRLNVSTLDSIKTALFLPIFIGLALFFFKGERLGVVVVTLVISLISPWLIRDFLVHNLEACLRAFKVVPFVIPIVILLIAGRFKLSPEALYAVIAAMGFYIGVFWWVMSDSRVEVLQDEPLAELHDALSPDDEDFGEPGESMKHPFWQQAWDSLCDKWKRVGYRSLTANEKVWLNVRCLIDSIENGGIISYYYNSGADDLPDCMAALDALDAVQFRKQLERVNALFPKGVPRTIDGRNEVIDSWGEDDEATDALLEEIDELLLPMCKGLEEQLEKFIRESGLAA